MSGFRLRALLEEVDFCSNLTGGSKEGKLADKNKFQTPSNVPNAASLLNNNIWADSGEDFNLEYMDLDEFLSETGLVDANFANIMNANPFSPAPAPQKAQTELSQSPINGLDNLLSSVDHTPSPSSSEQGVVSVTEATQQVLPAVTSPSPPSPSPESDAATKSPTKSKDVQSSEQPQINIVKKRKYKEDGEGLSDTAVVVVPGQEGFDPAQTKFAPEELQPQPIIKKSKKQFVPEENKDEKYWRRRNKNNVAAKRSREARRAKENQIIMRAGFLETENERLTRENEELIKENEELRDLVQKLKAQRK